MRLALLAVAAAAVAAAAPAAALADPVLQVYSTQPNAPSGQAMYEGGHQPIPTAAGQVAEEQVIASAPVDDLAQYEVIQLAFDGEYTVNHDEFGFYNHERWVSNVRHRVVLGSSPSDTAGTEIGAPLRDSVTPEQHHAALQRIVTHSVGTARPGRTWVNLVGRLEAEPGPNGNAGFDGFTTGAGTWANTWPLATIEPRYATASVQRWADRAGSAGGDFVGLGRSTALKAATLPLGGSVHAVRTTELELEPGDAVMLSAETNVEAQTSRSSGVQLNDEIRVERPGSADGETAGPRAGGLTFDVLPPADAYGAAQQRYHGVANRAAYVVPASAPAGTYRFHHVLRASAASDPGGHIFVGYGEISALALRDTPVSWRPRRQAAPGVASERIDRVVYDSTTQRRLTGAGDELRWPATSDRSAAASLSFVSTPHFCKQQPTSEYGPSTNPDARGAPRLRLASSTTAVRPSVNRYSPSGVHPFSIPAAGTVSVKLDNPFTNSGSPASPGNDPCTRGVTPTQLELRTAPEPAVATVSGLPGGVTLHTSSTTAVRQLSQDSAAPSTVHTLDVPNMKAGDRLVIGYRGVVAAEIGSATGPVTTSVDVKRTLPSAGEYRALRPTAENSTPASRYLAARRQAVFEVPASFGTVPQTLQVEVNVNTYTTNPARIATTSADQPYSTLSVVALRGE